MIILSCSSNEDIANRPMLLLHSIDISIGKNRIPFYIKHKDSSILNIEPDLLEIIYYKEDTNKNHKVKEIKWRNNPIKGGMYVADMNFLSSGIWIVEIKYANIKSPLKGQLIVKSKTDALDIGEKAPIIQTKVINDNNLIETITSDPHPDPSLYQISLDKALEKNIPILVTLSTPGYCQSYTCGPQTKVLSDLNNKFNDNQIQIIHIEIYDNPNEMKKSGDISIGIQSPQISEWGIKTEPWTFLINNNGMIVERYEGFVSFEELEEDINNLLN
tara:strand:+ start:17450 stop:18268 length:819 start_codon:yes stop_codon:yes gene_type:complete